MTIIEKYQQAKTWHERALILLIFHNLMVGQNKGWNIRLTAKRLDRSSGYVSEDLRLAQCIKDHPKMLQAIDRKSALKLMKDYE
jgi:hypothetical protein